MMDWEVISGKKFFLVREADLMHWLPFVPSFSNFDPKFWTKMTEFAVCEEQAAVRSEAKRGGDIRHYSNFRSIPPPSALVQSYLPVEVGHSLVKL